MTSNSALPDTREAAHAMFSRACDKPLHEWTIKELETGLAIAIDEFEQIAKAEGVWPDPLIEAAMAMNMSMIVDIQIEWWERPNPPSRLSEDHWRRVASKHRSRRS